MNDGEFVYDEKACKSGYALYFFGNGNLNEPNIGGRNYMYTRYVTLQDIDTTSSSNYCKIKNSIGDSNDIKIYDVNDLNSREMIINTYYYENDNYIGNYKNYHSQKSSSSLENLCDSNIKTKLEIFKKYIAIFTEDFQSKCTKSEKINDSYLETCGDNKLRKWSYLYANPEE